MTLEQSSTDEAMVTYLPPKKRVGRKSKALTDALNKSKPETKTRKRTKEPEELSPNQNWLIVSDYSKGELTTKKIAEKYNTSEDAVNLVVTRAWKTLTNMRESRALLSGNSIDSQKCLKAIHNTNLINQDFLALLSVESESNELSLTDAESIYCWVYVHTGDNEAALVQAGLDVGLFKTKSKEDIKLGYDKSCSLRGMYLRSLPHIASYIKELRERRFVDQDISKTRIQSELVDQLSQMKESGDPSCRKDILKTIELLGKTIGAFVERVEVTEIDPSKALDSLIDMAKQASIKELSSKSSMQTENWEVVE